jgi:hypothetical protein
MIIHGTYLPYIVFMEVKKIDISQSDNDATHNGSPRPVSFADFV